MSLDITFCDPKQCKLKETCARWIDNLKAKYFLEGNDLSNHYLSISDFSNHMKAEDLCEWWREYKCPK